MKNHGFTMIELLAAMVILSILVMVSVPTVLGVLDNNRKTTIISDSKKFISNVEYLINSNNNDIKRPRTINSCIVITLNYLDLGDDFKEGPHGKAYDKNKSFVVVKREESEDANSKYYKKYNYYVTLVEKLDDNSYYGIYNVSKKELSKDKVKGLGNSTIDYSSICDIVYN